MSSAFAQLTHNDAILIQAYLQGESEFQQVANNLQYSLVSLYQWLALPYILDAIKHIKSIELERAQIIATRARNTLTQRLNSALEDAAINLAQSERHKPKQPNDGATPTPISPAAAFYIKVASLLSRLATFKPIELKAAAQVMTKVAESSQPHQPSNY